jgi:hypothetical protein
MTPKEKAKELIEKYIPLTLRLYSDYDWGEDIDSAKQCALIAVDEIIWLLNNNQVDTDYYKELKQEIEKL